VAAAKEKMVKKKNRIRNTGLVCMAAAILWIIAIVIEYRYDLQPPGRGILYNLNHLMFLVSLTGYLIGILGLIGGRAAGDGRFGRFTLGLFAFGYSILIVATIVSLPAGNNDNWLFPIGGLAASLGCLLSGIAIVIAKRWQGWQRWSVLIYAIYYWAALFLPLVIANQEPNQITETIWGFAWLLLGLALFTNSRNSEMVTV
jgi:hypothetical protein